jgi:hypothetical protein
MSTLPPFVFFVGSPQARTGCSMVARLLADYYTISARPVQIFDTDCYEPAMAARFPDETIIADLSQIKGQMALFDRLLVPDDGVRIVDVWHRSWDSFVRILGDIDFMNEAQRVNILPVFVLVIDGSPRTLETARFLSRQWPQVMLLVVRNDGAAPMGPDAVEILARYPATRVFEIAPLDSVILETISRPGFSLTQFILDPPTDMSVVIRAGLRSWISRVFAQFRTFELRLALDNAHYLGGGGHSDDRDY